MSRERARPVEVVSVLVALAAVVVPVLIGWGFITNPKGDNAGASSKSTESTTTQAEATSTTSTTAPTASPVVAVEACAPVVDPDASWIQVESARSAPDRWRSATEVAQIDGLGICDGSGIFAGDGARLLISDPLTSAEVAQIDDTMPPPWLTGPCELRRLMRIAGGANDYRADGMGTYFSEFLIQPGGQEIGAEQCDSLLAHDLEYGSRAVLDRYFSVLSAVGGADIDAEEAAVQLTAVTTGAFLEKSGGTDAILAAWEECESVTVKWLSAPRPAHGFDTVSAELECGEHDGDRSDRDYQLSVAAMDTTPPTWRLHWDPEHWSTPPTI